MGVSSFPQTLKDSRFLFPLSNYLGGRGYRGAPGRVLMWQRVRSHRHDHHLRFWLPLRGSRILIAHCLHYPQGTSGPFGPLVMPQSVESARARLGAATRTPSISCLPRRTGAGFVDSVVSVVVASSLSRVLWRPDSGSVVDGREDGISCPAAKLVEAQWCAPGGLTFTLTAGYTRPCSIRQTGRHGPRCAPSPPNWTDTPSLVTISPRRRTRDCIPLAMHASGPGGGRSRGLSPRSLALHGLNSGISDSGLVVALPLCSPH